MEEKSNEIESLFLRATEYSKTSFEIIKLKTLDKGSVVVSSIITRLIYITMTAMCLLILSLGISYWIGEMLNKIYFGFIIVAAFWAVTGILLYFFFNKRIKKMIGDKIIKKATQTI